MAIAARFTVKADGLRVLRSRRLKRGDARELVILAAFWHSIA